jgi:hypothetical protein
MRCVLDWESGTRASFQCAASDAHREVLYAFIHSFLARATVEKACADSALCVPLILPVAILAPGSNWNKQIAASVLTRLPRTATVSSGSAIPERSSDALERLDQYAVGSRVLVDVFACDLGSLSPCDGLPPLTVCPKGVARRRRPLCRGAGDLQGQLRLHAVLLARRDPRCTGAVAAPLF